ncbi:GntR family transcriptional regulator [Microbacterium oxydans]|uniref:Transcriptional regulator PdhR n=1 Tax=Microbacterium oxydans TaxID=82380 RepID=A0A0F0L9C9_9MICO|nr:GntR family transcriptional regulator [Microbacterium oxydans]KJL29797.1 transcriptional regulator PdhR [Microbacterium oxydans]
MSNAATNTQGEAKQPLADEVFQHIGRQIIDGVLPPHYRIRDVEVAEELHVSRTPVREALQRLERHGLVVMYPSRYTEVTDVTPEIVEQSLEFVGYQTGFAARTGVLRLTLRQRERVATLVDRMSAALDDGIPVTEARWPVFSFLGEHSGNASLAALLDDAAVALFRNLRDWRVPTEDHDRMRGIYADFRDAVLAGDGDEAERLTREMHYV